MVNPAGRLATTSACGGVGWVKCHITDTVCVAPAASVKSHSLASPLSRSVGSATSAKCVKLLFMTEA